MEVQESHNPALEWRGKSARPIANSPSSPSPVFRIQSIYSQIRSIFLTSGADSPVQVCKLAMCAKQKIDAMYRTDCCALLWICRLVSCGCLWS